jgi:hypothetical protein
MGSQNTHASPIVNVSSTGTCSYASGFANTRLAQLVRVEDSAAMATELKIEKSGRRVYPTNDTTMTDLG